MKCPLECRGCARELVRLGPATLEQAHGSLPAERWGAPAEDPCPREVRCTRRTTPEVT